MKICVDVTKVTNKPWVLAPTLSKTVGAMAPTAPILTMALLVTYLGTNRYLHHSKLQKCVAAQ